MGLPPQLTPEQRQHALLKAAASRKRRAEVKEKMKNGELSIDNILEISKSEDAVAKIRVKELLESLSGVGKVRAQSLMERLNISPSRRIQGLGRLQVKQLREEFMKSEHAIKPGKLIVLLDFWI
jgi:guanylate kinase